MKGRVVKITIIFSLLLVAATGILALSTRKSSPQDDRSQQLVDLNEISQLIRRGDYDTAKQKTDEYADMLRSKPLEDSFGTKTSLLSGRLKGLIENPLLIQSAEY